MPSTTPTATRPSRPACEPAESLAEEHGATGAELRGVDELEVGELLLGQTEQLAVGAEVGPGGGHVVGREPGGEIRARIGKRFRSAELVEPGFGAGLDLLALLLGRSLATPSVVDVLVTPFLALDAGRPGSTRSGCCDRAGGGGEERGERKRWRAAASGGSPRHGARAWRFPLLVVRSDPFLRRGEYRPVAGRGQAATAGCGRRRACRPPDSAPQSSPGRPSSCRTAASGVGSRKLRKAPVAGSKRTSALAPKSLSQTLSRSST